MDAQTDDNSLAIAAKKSAGIATEVLRVPALATNYGNAFLDNRSKN